MGDEGLPWRVPLPEFVRKQVPECQQMFFVRDLDLIAPNVREVVAEGLPLHGGAQLVIDTTLVSALRSDGARQGPVQPPPMELRCKQRDGAKNALTLNLWVLAPALSWWCWRARSQDVGRQKL